MASPENYEYKEIHVDRELLPQINANCDFRELFFALGLKEAKGSKPYNLKAILPFKAENKPSFHINKKGCITCNGFTSCVCRVLDCGMTCCCVPCCRSGDTPLSCNDN